MPVSPTPLQAAIVDLDGTLVDTLGDFDAALNAVLADLRLPPVDRPTVERNVGQGGAHLIARTLADLGADPALAEPAWVAFQRHYQAINGRHAVVFPGVVAGLQRLRGAGLPLACLTNKPGAFARPLLAAMGLDGFFSHVFGGDAFARKKPDPLPLLETCRALGSLPLATLMLGDSRSDADAARAAGCPFVLVRYGDNSVWPLDAAAPDAVITRLDALRWPGLPA